MKLQSGSGTAGDVFQRCQESCSKREEGISYLIHMQKVVSRRNKTFVLVLKKYLIYFNSCSSYYVHFHAYMVGFVAHY